MVDTGEGSNTGSTGRNASAIGEWEINPGIGMRRMEIGELIQL